LAKTRAGLTNRCGRCKKGPILVFFQHSLEGRIVLIKVGIWLPKALKKPKRVGNEITPGVRLVQRGRFRDFEGFCLLFALKSKSLAA
jgi:hypothetical protein